MSSGKKLQIKVKSRAVPQLTPQLVEPPVPVASPTQQKPVAVSSPKLNGELDFSIIMDGKTLAGLMGAIKALAIESTLKIEPAGMKLRAIDPAGLAILNMDIPNNYTSIFREYQCARPQSVSIGLESFMIPVDAESRTEGKIELWKKKSENFVRVSLLKEVQNTKVRFSDWQIEQTTPIIDVWRVKLPEIRTDVSLTVRTEELAKRVSSYQSVGGQFTIEVDKTQISLKTRTDVLRGTVTYTPAMAKQFKVWDTFSGKFDLNFELKYTAALLVSGSGFSEWLTLHLGKDQNLRIEYFTSMGVIEQFQARKPVLMGAI